ncbi:MAG: ParB/RepB/Spo0J family partition protein [Roseburia sp.]
MARAITSEDIFGGMFQGYEEKPADKEKKQSTDPVVKVRCDKLHQFKGHPFRVVDDESMAALVDSIKQYGIQEPLLVRPDQSHPGEYEIISGHRRNHAAGLAGLNEVPVYICDMDDDTATVIMVDANIKREEILPSEKAFAYRMKADAMRHQGKRNDLIEESPADGIKEVGEKNGDSVRTVQRYIRLTYLEKELLDLVDAGKLQIGVAYTISFFSCENQRTLVEYYEKYHKIPDKSQIEKLAEYAKNGLLSEQVILGTLPQPKVKQESVTLKGNRIKKYFPEGTTSAEMERLIISLLEDYVQSHDVGEKE